MDRAYLGNSSSDFPSQMRGLMEKHMDVNRDVFGIRPAIAKSWSQNV